MLAEFFAWLYAYLARHTLTPIAAVLFVEEAGIPSPIPGDGLMLMAGVRVAEGHASLATVLLVEELATVAGATVLFTLSRRLGRPAVTRLGRYVGITEARLAKAEARFHRHDMGTVFVGRLIPGLRVPTVVAAGLLQVPPIRFFPAMAAGAFVNLATFTVLGAAVGRPVVRLFARFAFPLGALWSVAALGGIVFLLRELRHVEAARAAIRHTWTGALGAGALAVFAGILVDNVLLDVITAVDRATGTGPVPAFRAALQAHLLLRWPWFLALALLLVALGHRLGIEAWSRAPRFAVHALVPAGASVLLSVAVYTSEVSPVAYLAPFALVLLATASARWLAFGAALEFLHTAEVTVAAPATSAAANAESASR